MRNWNLLLLMALLASLGAHLWVSHDPARPNFEYLPEMVHSIAYDAYAPNPAFPDGKTLQEPVTGTMRRGFERVRYTASPEDAIRAGRELANPADPAAAVPRGAAVYQTFCLPCHGAAGRGDGPVVLRGHPAPPNLLSGKTLELTDGRMFHILTFGQKNMPAYAVQLAPSDRWNAIVHVRSMQRAAAAAAKAVQRPSGATAPARSEPETKP